MNIKEEILKKYGKAQCLQIVDWVGNNQKRFDELFLLFNSEEYYVAKQSSWPLSHCVHANPTFIEKHFDNLVKILHKESTHYSVKCNCMRLLQFVNIPEEYHGDLMICCFEIIQNVQEKPALKTYALTVLNNLSHHYPEIKPELILIIEEQMPYESAAFKSRAKKILAKK